MEDRDYNGSQAIIRNALRMLGVIKSTKENKGNPLILEINSTLEELEEVRQYFNYVNEPELLEYAIYKEKAITRKLSFLLKQAKIENDKVKLSTTGAFTSVEL